MIKSALIEMELLVVNALHLAASRASKMAVVSSDTEMLGSVAATYAVDRSLFRKLIENAVNRDPVQGMFAGNRLKDFSRSQGFVAFHDGAQDKNPVEGGFQLCLLQIFTGQLGSVL